MGIIREEIIGDCRLLLGDCLEILPGLESGSINTCVTSPPYFGLRDYGNVNQIGLEQTPDEYVAKLVAVFREVRRVLRDDGTLWLNLGDSYGTGTTAARKQGSRGLGAGTGDAQDAVPRCGGMAKQLLGIPWRVAFALQADGWYLRQDIIWSKPNPMPESVTDRCTKAHEYIFLLSKSARYFYDAEAIKEPAQNWGTRERANFRDGTTDKKLKHYGLKGSAEENQTRNKRPIWTVNTKSYKGAHFATFPTELINPCILAGCPKGGTVLDVFNGSGTTGKVSIKNGRKYIGIELNQEYLSMSMDRIRDAHKARPRLFDALPVEKPVQQSMFV